MTDRINTLSEALFVLVSKHGLRTTLIDEFRAFLSKQPEFAPNPFTEHWKEEQQ